MVRGVSTLLFVLLFLLACFTYPRLALATGDLLHLTPLLQRTLLQLGGALALSGLLLAGYEYGRFRGGARGAPAGARLLALLLLVALLALTNTTLSADDLRSFVLRCGLFVYVAQALLLRPATLIPPRPLGWALAAYAAALTVACTAAAHLPVALRWTLDQVLLLLFFLALRGSAPDPGALRRYLRGVLLLGLTVAALHGLLQAGGHDWFAWEGTLPVAGAQRVVTQATGIFGNPNFFGILMLVAMLLAGGTAADRALTSRLRFTAALAAVPAACGLLLSYSRSAWVIAAATACIALWSARKQLTPRRLLLAVAALLLLLAPVLFAHHDLIARRLQSLTGGGRSLAARLLLYESALRLTLQRPLTGWGPDHFQFVFDRAIDPAFFRFYPPSVNFLQHTHNEFLQVLAETGVPGLAAWLLLLAAAFHAARGGGACTAAASALLAAELFSFNFRFLLFPFLCWLLLALGAARPTAPPPPAAPRLRRLLPLLLFVAALLWFSQPYFASGYARLGALYPRDGFAGYSLPRVFYLHALAYDDACLRAHLELAELYWSAGEYADSRIHLQELQRYSRTYGNSDRRLAEVCRLLGDTAAAAHHRQRAAVLEPYQ